MRKIEKLEQDILDLIKKYEKEHDFEVREGRIEKGIDGKLKCYLNSTDEKAWLPCDGSFITGPH